MLNVFLTTQSHFQEQQIHVTKAATQQTHAKCRTNEQLSVHRAAELTVDSRFSTRQARYLVADTRFIASRHLMHDEANLRVSNCLPCWDNKGMSVDCGLK